MIIKRFIFNELVEDISKKYISVLLGTRQIGKTTLLKKLSEYCAKNSIPYLFYDLEQPMDLMEFNKSESEVIKNLSQQDGVVFIDEFQYIKNASKIFKAIYDSANTKVKIFASGSSSIEIHKHLKESLAGRKRTYNIFPLTYKELSEHSFSIDEYFIYGGLPGLVHEKEKKNKLRLLEDVLKSYILKDIRSLIKEENIRAFNHMLYILAQNQGQIISSASLANDIGMSSKAVNHYLNVMKETFILYPVYSFSNNMGNELKKSQKFYLYDFGIRNSILKDFSEISSRNDAGAIMESFVLYNLLPHIEQDTSINFWRTREGDEVDFILLKNRKPIPIEVKTSWNDKHRLPKGLSIFLDRYKKTKKAFIFTLNKSAFSEILYNGIAVELVSDIDDLKRRIMNLM